MKVCLTLICFLLLTLQDGETGEARRAMEGTDITVACSFSFSGSKRLFCRKNCKGENILIETTKNQDKKGRYSIEYKADSTVLYVTITKLIPSDSGQYRCGLSTVWPFGNRYQDFDLEVTKASTTAKPSGKSSPATTAAGSTLRLSSSSSSSLSETIHQTGTSAEQKAVSATELLLYVGLVLAIFILLLAAALLIFFKRKRFTKQKGPPVETHVDFTLANRVYEEVREENRNNKPHPGEISTVYAYAKSSKPNVDESSGVYSLASCPQSKKEDDEVDYSEVHLSNDATSSASIPRGLVDDIIYSGAQTAMNSADTNNG